METQDFVSKLQFWGAQGSWFGSIESAGFQAGFGAFSGGVWPHIGVLEGRFRSIEIEFNR
jgi:hypothetical protein